MRSKAKGVAMHHRDALGREQVFDEILVGLDDLALRRFLAKEPGTGRVDVERSLRQRAMQPRDLVQCRDDQIAPLSACASASVCP